MDSHNETLLYISRFIIINQMKIWVVKKMNQIKTLNPAEILDTNISLKAKIEECWQNTNNFSLPFHNEK